MASVYSVEDADRLAEARRVEILTAGDGASVTGRSFYVSALGDDENDGLSPEHPWRSLGRVSRAELLPGDGVLFRRGDLFRGSLEAKPHVTYAAYGEGKKPRLYGWDYDLADPDLWEVWDRDHNIWRMKHPIPDCGTLVFNHGERHGRKLIPSYKNGGFVVRGDEGREFRMAEQMSRDLDLFCRVDSVLTEKPSRGESFPVPLVDGTLGELYLRCDGGNPGEIFSSVEALPRRNMIRVGSAAGVRIDNLCIKYVGAHGVAAGGYSEGLTVTGCEFGWIGGTVQHYFGTDPNYPKGGRGTVTRYGNAVEVYGGCKDYTVSDCYIYQCYDAGITHQITTNGKRVVMENVLYCRNLVEYCVYSIEYFLEKNMGDRESLMRSIRICDNILRHSGEGWGQQRHNTDTPAHIKGWSYENTASDFLISGNVFDRAAYRMLHLVARDRQSLPRVEGNTYIQYLGKPLGQYGANTEAEPPVMSFGSDAEERIRDVLGDTAATVVYVNNYLQMEKK